MMPRLRLSARLSLSFILPVLLALLTLGVIADHVAQQTFEDQFAERLLSVGFSIRAHFGTSKLTYRKTRFWTERLPVSETQQRRLRDYLEALRRETGARRIFIFDLEEHSIIDTQKGVSLGQQLHELALDHHELRVVRAGNAQASTLYCAASEDSRSEESGVGLLGCDGRDRPFKTAYVPIFGDDGAMVGIIGVEGSAEQLSELSDLRKNLLFIAGIALSLIILVSLWVARQLTRPVYQLVEAARRIGSGDLEHNIPRTRQDEFGDLEESLEEMRSSLCDRDQQMQMMLSGVAHEVRNPLGGIQLFLGLLQEDLSIAEIQGVDGAELRDYVDKIGREMRYLERVVNEFLEFARRDHVEIDRFPAMDFLREIVQVIEGDPLAEGIQIILDVEEENEGENPGVGPELTADQDRIRRVLLNLLRNALQASEVGSTVVLKLRSPSPRERLLEVIDQGSGISPEHLSQVFQPFFTTREKGTGLGLPLSQKIIASHQGEIRAASVQGEGTTISITLPFHAELLSAPKIEIPEGWLG